MFTIPINSNRGIRISTRTPPEKPEREPTESIPPIGVSIPQAAKLLNIGKPLLARLVKTEQIRAVKLGKRVVISVQSLRDFVDGKTTPAAPNGGRIPPGTSVEKSGELSKNNE
jgi:excisionase family DNA binding protein